MRAQGLVRPARPASLAAGLDHLRLSVEGLVARLGAHGGSPRPSPGGPAAEPRAGNGRTAVPVRARRRAFATRTSLVRLGESSGFAASSRPAREEEPGARMKVYTTAPLEDPRDVPGTFRRLEEIGYDGGFSFEAKHDPFLPLALAAEHDDAPAPRHGRRHRVRAQPDEPRQPGATGSSCSPAGASCSGSARRCGRTSSIASACPGRGRPRACARWCWPSAPSSSAGRARAELDFRGRVLPAHADDPGLRSRARTPSDRRRSSLGGFGPRMTEVAGEVADGFFAHPFNTRKSLLENTLPALERGLATSGRTRARSRDRVRHDRRRRPIDEEELRARQGRGEQAARVLRLDARLPLHARLPRLGRAAH